MSAETFSGVIDSFIKPSALKDFDHLYTKIDGSIKKFNELSLVISKISPEISNTSASYTEFISKSKQITEIEKDLKSQQQTISKLTNEIKKLNAAKQAGNKDSSEDSKTRLNAAKAAKEQALAAKAEAQARKENAIAAEKETKVISNAAKETANSAKARATEQKAIDQVTNEYIQLSIAYNETALKAKNYALTLGENHPVTIAAIADAKAMYDILYRLDQKVGQSQRNVGNYKSAFDGLGMSFTQVARELPSLTISASQFLLAISNNLPMVSDEIAKARKEIAALRAEGKEAPSLFSRIAGSLISWNIGLSVGIALLTAYGEKIIDWAKGLFDGSKAAKEAAKRQHELNEVQQKSLDIQEKYKSTTEHIFGVRDRELENQLVYLRAQGKSEEDILKIEKQLLKNRQELASEMFFNTNGLAELGRLKKGLTEASDAYEEFLKHPLVFGESVEYGSEEYKAREDQLRSSFDLQARLYGKQKEIVTEYFNANRDVVAKDLEYQKLVSEKRIHFFSEELQERADQLTQFSQLEELSLSTRNKARREANELQLSILSGQQQDELFDARGNNEKIFEINREYSYKRKVLAEQLAFDLTVIQQSYRRYMIESDAAINKSFTEEQEKRKEQELELGERLFEIRKNELDKNRDILIRSALAERNIKLSAAKSDAERQKIEEYYNNKRAKIELDTNRFIMLSAIDLAESKLKKIQDPALTAALQAQIAELKRQLSELEGIEINLNTDTARRNLENLRDNISEIGNQILSAFESISSILNGNIDKQRNAISEQINSLEEKKQKDIEVANAESGTAEEKAARINIINVRSQAQKEQLERKQRQLDLQKARFEKARNIMEATLRTAVAVLEGLIKGGPPLAAVYGAIGGLQIAAAARAQLPQYSHGKWDSSYQGPAIVSEDGPELYLDGGKAFLTPDRPSIMNVSRNSRILPHDITTSLLEPTLDRTNGNHLSFQNNNIVKKLLQQGKEQSHAIINAIKGSKPVQVANLYVNLGWYNHINQHVFGK